MTADLDPKVRDRAAQAAKAEWQSGAEGFHYRGWPGIVDAVAEVLAAEQVFPFRTPEQHHARYLELLGPVVRERDELKARVQQLTAAYTDLEAHRPPEYPVLRARVDELTAALRGIVAYWDDEFKSPTQSVYRWRELISVEARAALAAAVEERTGD